jgi:phosphoribosylamine--glycine ligase
MRIAVVGAGGREHALAWKCAQEVGSDNVHVVPGNAGTDAVGRNVPIEPSDSDRLVQFADQQAIDLLIVGPEGPLAAGLADCFAGRRTKVFGPGARAARLESSKVWAKGFMQRHGVATARSTVIDVHTDVPACLRDYPDGVVIKYDGLAAGKGVVVCDSAEEGLAAVAQTRRTYGAAAHLVIEERLFGDEVSLIGVTDGRSIRPLHPAQDHKQLHDGDHGPNTGGMGAYCPVPRLTAAALSRIERTIVAPTMDGLQRDGLAYCGALYFGLMITDDGPRLLEYNVRFGDPETQVLIPALSGSLTDLLWSCCCHTAHEQVVSMRPGFFVDVVLASAGYPEAPVTGVPVVDAGPDQPEALVFHAGVVRSGGHLMTAGGRVLSVVGHGVTLDAAIACAYARSSRIQFEGMHFRRDIGRRTWVTA